MQLKVKRLHSDAKLPTHGHPGDAGMDFYAIHDVTFLAGKQERVFVDNLMSVGYKGTVLFDDIHLNEGMKQFWSSVTQEKHDYTSYGHWSGTGVVTFK